MYTLTILRLTSEPMRSCRRCETASGPATTFCLGCARPERPSVSLSLGRPTRSWWARLQPGPASPGDHRPRIRAQRDPHPAPDGSSAIRCSTPGDRAHGPHGPRQRPEAPNQRRGARLGNEPLALSVSTSTFGVVARVASWVIIGTGLLVCVLHLRWTRARLQRDRTPTPRSESTPQPTDTRTAGQKPRAAHHG